MTGPALYLRRCNGQPTAGVPVDRAAVELATRPRPGIAVSGDLDSGLAVHVSAGRPWEVEQYGTQPRLFTYTPVQEDPCADTQASPGR
jgi:hypothetical protein